MRDITVAHMLETIAKAYVATKTTDGVSRIRAMKYERLVDEYHWAIVTLDAKGLLSREEQLRAQQYAREYLSPLPVAS